MGKNNANRNIANNYQLAQFSYSYDKVEFTTYIICENNRNYTLEQFQSLFYQQVVNPSDSLKDYRHGVWSLLVDERADKELIYADIRAGMADFVKSPKLKLEPVTAIKKLYYDSVTFQSTIIVSPDEEITEDMKQRKLYEQVMASTTKYQDLRHQAYKKFLYLEAAISDTDFVTDTGYNSISISSPLDGFVFNDD